MDQKPVHKRPMKVYKLLLIVGDKIGKVRAASTAKKQGILPNHAQKTRINKKNL